MAFNTLRFLPLAAALTIAVVAPLHAQLAWNLAEESILPVADIKQGMTGEVRTVFMGTRIESFAVRVTGILSNGLGPGKDLIICELTDPRVQASGAVAGMSGSPLYINGRLAGALSYQLQRFETVRFAGFTPIRDMLEVGMIPPSLEPMPLQRSGATGKEKDDIVALQPVFALSGISPKVADLFKPQLEAIGLNVVSLGGNSGSTAPTEAITSFEPGGAVAVALATGDISVAATGTVSMVDGNRLLAFGHPLLSLGDVDLPMATSEIVTILPSALSSFKVSNTGPVVGTINQDRLSAVYGEVGRSPLMIPVHVEVATPAGKRTLNFEVIRHELLAPQIAAMGVAQAVMGWNAAGVANGYELDVEITFNGREPLRRRAIFAGPGGFASGIAAFTQELTAWISNPITRIFPDKISFKVDAMTRNPALIVDQFIIERQEVTGGDTLRVAVAVRGFQQESEKAVVEIPIDPSWAGRNLEVVLADGPTLDEWTGRPRTLSLAGMRDFERLVSYVRSLRPTDGVFLAVVESGAIIADQQDNARDYPGSVERIVRGADASRFEKRDAVFPLWEKQLFPGTVTTHS
ncbi:MAG TPA: SpoIVB peptidase S55 domain-containing protein, partial [Opitutaceae bacterium]|nr:SpoIVB peptidase S55 domain-containing protein [Opitutaceae bacterium]